MAMPWSLTLNMAMMVWMALNSWVVSCVEVAEEIAQSLRNRDISISYMGRLIDWLMGLCSFFLFSVWGTLKLKSIAFSLLVGVILCISLVSCCRFNDFRDGLLWIILLCFLDMLLKIVTGVWISVRFVSQFYLICPFWGWKNKEEHV